MVFIYIADVKNLPDPLLNPTIMERILKERKQTILKLKKENDRKRSLGAGLLLRECLSRHGKDQSKVTYGIHGKPEMPDTFFNLSHAGNYAVCVISDKEVGCDVEKIQDLKSNVAKRVFKESENVYLERFEEQKKLEEFYRLWTLKESFLKMTGEGLSAALQSIEFVIGDEIKVFKEDALYPCYVKEYDIPGYKLSVCGKENEFAEELEWIVFTDINHANSNPLV